MDKIVIIQGPTASGKSDFAVQLAEQCDGEIVNADSMQVYRHLDIGTAKPSLELRAQIPHHLVDIVDPDKPFTAADFASLATGAINEILNRGKMPIIVGGTGLYIKALTKGLINSPGEDKLIRSELQMILAEQGRGELMRRLTEVDPATAAQLHPNDTLRIIRALEVYAQTGQPVSVFRSEHQFAETRFTCLKLGINIPREELYRRIDSRVIAMMEQGLVQEVESLLAQGYGQKLKAMQSIGYKETVDYLVGKTTLAETIALIQRNTRHYAKRQMTWFKSDNEIKWVEYPKDFDTIHNIVIEFFY